MSAIEQHGVVRYLASQLDSIGSKIAIHSLPSSPPKLTVYLPVLNDGRYSGAYGRCMTAFPKADVQNIGIRTELNVRLWPKADIHMSFHDP